ncbi:hypothetical protein SEUCBS139899_009010 [Sporothrix eucalyptigena]|uniref:Uncharacterized protein n=1 Tax=Sporothrix eucalyptigena TaxID=1812306 RepID=A0ABP0AKS2_9PEZI
MEPRAKRAKVGRASHDALPLDGNVDVNVNKPGSKANKAGESNDDDDDEIAMDPEDYAMKVDPEYRLDRSRAVAENKLKSAFELLFEKYSQDFGDTGDEINFYTDEIEVDNGHIASLPAKGVRGRRKAAAAADESISYSSRGDASRLASLLPSRFGSGGTVIMGSATQTGPYRSSDAPGAATGTEAIDPTWAAPEIPGLAFSTPGGHLPHPPPPRSAYAVPQRTIFTKTLAISHAEGLGEDGDDEDDDLILDTPRTDSKAVDGMERPPSSAVSKKVVKTPKTTKKRREKTFSTAETPKDAYSKLGVEVASPDLPTTDQALPKPRRGRRKSDKAVLERMAVPDSMSPERPLSDLPSSAPLPAPSDDPVESAEANEPEAEPVPEVSQAASSSKVKSKETFSRNVIDSSFVFSDDENFGFKRRKKTQKMKSTLTAAPVAQPQEDAPQVQTGAVDDNAASVESVPIVKKRRPGRPRKSSSNVEAAKEKTVEPAPRRYRKEDLSIIIMTSSVPLSSEPSPVPTAAPAPISVPVPVVTEPEPTPTDATPVPEIAATPEDEPTPPSREATSEPERPRKRRRQPTQGTDSSARKTRRHEIPDSQGNSSGIISLVSDGSADEAEIDKIAAATPLPFAPSGPGGSSGRLPLSGARRSVQVTPSGRKQLTPSSRRSLLLGTPSRQQHYAKAVMGSPLARRQQALLLASDGGEVPSPGGSPIQTPGGTIRRCGKDGFRCEREFCFRCT